MQQGSGGPGTSKAPASIEARAQQQAALQRGRPVRLDDVQDAAEVFVDQPD